MRTLYLDCGMGAAGDMLTAALYELLEDGEKQEFMEQMNALGLFGVRMSAEKMTKCGVTGTHMKVEIYGAEEDEHCHEAHFNEHSHSGMHEIRCILEKMAVSENVRENAAAVYELIAAAESRVHGVPVTEIHFHEVGNKDAIADVTAVSLLLEKLKIEKVIASPVHVGSGQVRCAHGILPVPAPATAEILKGVPLYGGEVAGELCTPTGAALLKHFVSSFGEMPVMKVEKIGYGMGRKDFERANCVRAMLGETENAGDKICELSCNLDDMTAERLGFAMEGLLAAGALDVYTVPIGMKKSRPGQLLCVMCREEDRETMLRLIFKHTTTLGVRENVSRRYSLSRTIEKRKTVFGEVRVKISEGFGVMREKYEYEDLAEIAAEKELSIGEVVRRIEENLEKTE